MRPLTIFQIARGLYFYDLIELLRTEANETAYKQSHSFCFGLCKTLRLPHILYYF